MVKVGGRALSLASEGCQGEEDVQGGKDVVGGVCNSSTTRQRSIRLLLAVETLENSQ